MDLPESRLDSLYKDFGYLKELNPEGYNANIDTWKSYLTRNYLSSSESLFLNCGSDFLVKLRRAPQGLPKSIDIVLDSLAEDEYLVALDDFYKGAMYPQEESVFLKWIGWRFRSRKKINLRRNHEDHYLKDVTLIIKPVVEKKFEHIKAQLENNITSKATGIADLVFSKKEFYHKCGFHRILSDSEVERKAMLFYLSHYKKLIVQDKGIIKVIAPEVDHLLADFQRNVTEDDHRIANLKSSLSHLEGQIKTLKDQVADYASLLKESILNSAPKETQRNYLQGKKMVEKNLTRLVNQQTSLANVKTQLNMAATNALVFRTLQESSKLLKSINDSVGSVDKVEELLDEIKEQGERAEELNEILAKSPDAEAEEELERELEAMAAEEICKKENADEATEQRKENEVIEQESEKMVEKLNRLHISSKLKEPSKKDLNSIPQETSEPIAEA